MHYFLISILPHLTVGAVINYLICNNEKNRFYILLIGAFAGILPDIPKYFNNIFFHSIWSIPIISIILSIPSKKIIKDISLIRLFLGISMSALIGHIFIDYIGNGTVLFYPFTQEEFSLDLINGEEIILWVIILVGIILSIFNKHSRKIILISSIIAFIYIGVLGFSKYVTYQQLESIYKEDKPNQILVYRAGYPMHWYFIVRTDEKSVNGTSFLNHFNEEHVYYFGE